MAAQRLRPRRRRRWSGWQAGRVRPRRPRPAAPGPDGSVEIYAASLASARHRDRAPWYPRRAWSRSRSVPDRIEARSRIDARPWCGSPSSGPSVKPEPSSAIAHGVAGSRGDPVTATSMRRRSGVLDRVGDRFAHDLIQAHLIVGLEPVGRADVERDLHRVAAFELVGQRLHGGHESLVAQHPRLQREAQLAQRADHRALAARGRSPGSASVGSDSGTAAEILGHRVQHHAPRPRASAADRRAGAARACGARPARRRPAGGTARRAPTRGSGPGPAAPRRARTAARSRPRGRRSRRTPPRG